MKFFGMPVRVIKKGKKRGRRSKMEIMASKVLSHYIQTAEVQKTLEDMQTDMMLYGVAITPKKLKQ